MSGSSTPARSRLPERTYFALVFSVVLAALAGLSYLAIHASVKQARAQLLQRIEAGERQAVAAMEREATNTLFEVTADLQTFRTVFQRVPGTEEVRERVARFMRDFMGSHRSYDQLRLIGADGFERLRIDNEPHGPEVTPRDRLQDKSGSSYMQLAVKLGPRDVLIAPLDVNRENGQVELPLNPVIRVIGRVKFSNEEESGFLVLNYRAALLLENMRAIGETAIGQPRVVSGRGVETFELLEMDTPEVFTGTVPAPSFAERFPSVWAALERDPGQGIDDGAGGFVVASKFQPATLTIPDTIGDDLSFKSPMQGRPDREGHLYIVSHVDGESMNDLIRLSLRLSRSTLALFAAVLVGLAWFIALRLSGYRSYAAHMRSRATTDALTGLLNRGEFEKRLRIAAAQAQRYGRAMALLYIDLDGFKAINDERGHAVGDALLRHVAEWLTTAVRGTDVVGRLGGDEFAVVLTEMRGRTDMRAVAEKLRRHINRSVVLAGETVQVGGSVGGAAFPDDADTVDALLETADRAMYAEKAARRQARGAVS